MEILEVEGVVLKKVDYGEADRIVTLLCAQRGKVVASIKGIRKSKNRETYATEPLVLGQYKINKRNNSATINKLAVENPYIKIKGNYLKLQVAIYLLKLTDTITFEDIDSKSIYKLLKNSLDYLERSEDEKMIFIMLTYFLYKIIINEGLKYKVEVGEYFDFEKGMITTKKGLNSVKLTTYELEHLEYLNKVDIGSINKIQSNNKQILEVARKLEKYLNYNLHLGINIYTYIGEEVL